MQYYVGGNSKFYGGVLWRLRPADFGRSAHADGESAAWPIGYDDLEPYYGLAERVYGVRGTIGADPTEPPHSAPYAHPALPHEPPMARLRRLASTGCARSSPRSRLVRRRRRLHPLSDLRRVSVPDRCQGRRRDQLPAAGPAGSQRRAADRQPGHPRPDQHRRAGDRRRGHPRRRAEHRGGRHRRGRVRGGQLGCAATPVGRARAPPRRGQLVRASRPELHAAHQHVPDRDRTAAAEPDQVPEDARGQRLLLRRARLPLPNGRAADDRQARRDDARGRPPAGSCRAHCGRSWPAGAPTGS